MSWEAPFAIALCGLAFSGKSTFARRIAATLDCALIVLDDINAERGLDGSRGLGIAQWEETSWIAMERLCAALAEGRSAVMDDTHSHRILRDRFRTVAHRHGARSAILFVDTPLATVAARRAENDARPSRPSLADSVFEAHHAGFQWPAPDETDIVRITDEADVAQWLARQITTGDGK